MSKESSERENLDPEFEKMIKEGKLDSEAEERAQRLKEELDETEKSRKEAKEK